MSGRLYLDTGALVKLYVIEPGSEWVEAQCQQADALLLCPLQLTELRNAILAAGGRGILSMHSMQDTLRNIETDLGQAIFVRTHPDWTSIWQRADALARQYTPELLCRTLDILHVAAAEATGAEQIITGDKRQYALCQALKFPSKRIPS